MTNFTNRIRYNLPNNIKTGKKCNLRTHSLSVCVDRFLIRHYQLCRTYIMIYKSMYDQERLGIADSFLIFL